MEKQYQWRIEQLPGRPETGETAYINQCCEFGDTVLEMIKDAVGENLKAERTEIGQEDWGWYLLCEKDGRLYELDISFQNVENGRYLFGVVLSVKKSRKILFFDFPVAAEPESLAEFDEIVGESAGLCGIAQSDV
jgi:hypothetical protein